MLKTSRHTSGSVASDGRRRVSRRFALVSLGAAVLLSQGVGSLPGGGPPTTLVSVTTWRYNNTGSGANTDENLLTPSNVNSANFGKLSTDPVQTSLVSLGLLNGSWGAQRDL